MSIKFMSDQVKIKTGKVDHSAQVTFEVGEYELHKLKELVAIVDEIMEVNVEILK